MIDNKLRQSFQFFLNNAGYIVGERSKGALELAKAEREVNNRDWYFEYEPEEESYLDVYGVLDCCERANQKCAAESHGHSRYQVCPDHYDSTHADLSCVILMDSDGNLLEATGMIANDRIERRLVEADLALEALKTRE